MKAIKLSPTYYMIVVEDKERKDGESYVYRTNYRVTHETDLSGLEGNIKHIPLSEVEEAIYGYSAEKMAKELLPDDGDWQRRFDVIKGVNAHKELVKDKLFTVEDMINAFIEGCNQKYSEKRTTPEQYVQSLLPKTEWEITFDEQGKLKLV